MECNSGSPPSSQGPSGPLAGEVDGAPFSLAYARASKGADRVDFVFATYDVSCGSAVLPSGGAIQVVVSIPASLAQPGETAFPADAATTTSVASLFAMDDAGDPVTNDFVPISGTLDLETITDTTMTGWLTASGPDASADAADAGDGGGGATRVAGHFVALICP